MEARKQYMEVLKGTWVLADLVLQNEPRFLQGFIV